jgi:hypothetical protein
LQGLEGQIDVIVDDGLHSISPVTETFKNLWPLLSPTGIYLLEDIRSDVDLHDPSRRYPFRTMDPNNFDSATFNHLQVPMPPFRNQRAHNLLQRFEDSSGYEALWAVYPPRSIAPKTISKQPVCA